MIGADQDYLGRDRRRIEGAYHDDSGLENRVDEEAALETDTVTNGDQGTNNARINQGPAIQPSSRFDAENAWR